MIVLISCKVQM